MVFSGSGIHLPSTINLYRCRPAGSCNVTSQSPLASLRIGVAVAGFQLLKSPAMRMVCASGALAAPSENSTLNGRDGLGFVGGGVGAGAGVGDGVDVCGAAGVW